MDFYKCRHCGNILTFIQFSENVPFCCGESMHRLTANNVEASVEKHIPMVNITGNQIKVQVGSIEHPMQDVHYIEWIALEMTSGQIQIKYLHPGEKPEAEFLITGADTIKTIYAYCNLHGLWGADVPCK